MGVQDIKTSTCTDFAAEMMLFSLCYLSDSPSPEQVFKKVPPHNTQQRIWVAHRAHRKKKSTIITRN
jgi:hypothetical protein